MTGRPKLTNAVFGRGLHRPGARAGEADQLIPENTGTAGLTRLSALRRLAASLICLAVVGAVSVAFAGAAVHAGRTVFADDLPLVRFLADHRSGFLTGLARTVSTIAAPTGLAVTLALVTGAMRLRWKTWEPMALSACALAGIGLIGSGVKAWVARPRPPLSLSVPDVSARGFAFPSGHTAQATATYGMLAWVMWRHYRHSLDQRSARSGWWILLAAVAAFALVGFCRLYLGVHWLSDVLAGWILGFSWLAVVIAADVALQAHLRARRASG